MITDANAGGDDDVPPDVAAALAHPRRREVVEQLHARGALSLVALADRLVADAPGTLPDVVVELHDRHLPELRRCGLLAYDDDTGMVTLAAEGVVEAAVAEARPDDA
ncbi:MAG: hypothetical protein ABEJ61_00765 [Haloferacaceae archaeon]